MTTLAVLAGVLAVLGAVQACGTQASGGGRALVLSPVRIPAGTSPAARIPATVQEAASACGIEREETLAALTVLIARSESFRVARNEFVRVRLLCGFVSRIF